MDGIVNIGGSGATGDMRNRLEKDSQLRQEITGRIQKLFFQLTDGCGYPLCENPYCASNPKMVKVTANEAAALALRMASDNVSHSCGVSSPLPELEWYILLMYTPEPCLQVDGLRAAAKRDPSGAEVERLVRTVFSSPDSLNRSFVKANHSSVIKDKEPMLSGGAGGSLSVVTVDGRQAACEVNDVDMDEHSQAIFKITVDVADVREAYRVIFAQEQNATAMVEALSEWVIAEAQAMDDRDFQYMRSETMILNQYMTILENPHIAEPEYHASVMVKLVQMLAELPDNAHNVLVTCWGQYDVAHMEHLVRVFQQFITMQLIQEIAVDEDYCPNEDDALCCGVICLGIVYRANVCKGKPLVPIEEFYNDAINEHMDLRVDFPNWKTHDGFSFIDHPFVLDPAMKSEVLRAENSVQMRSEMQDAFFRAIFAGPQDPYMQLRIRREHLIRDALTQLNSKRPSDLKKMLRVQFAGEDGVDEGGVRKEFFQLVVREIFDPKYGMFTYDRDHRMYWFNPGAVHLNMNNEYYLIGLILGLAIYNSIILDVRFPLVVYKKLLAAPVTLDDLRQSHPELGRGLQQLLEYEGDVESVYARHFEVEYEAFGSIETRELKEGGAAIPLTNENREEYVRLYVDWSLNTSVEMQFAEFKRGFDKVAAGGALGLFRPEEVELLVCGSPDLDFAALKANTVYDGGFTEESDVIRHFWEIIDEFTDNQKKQLLFFATGSDRVPIGGLARLGFVIAKNGPDSDRLPTAHTCFNVLLLADYSSKEKLRERLLTAIANAEGFGMI